MAKYFRYILVGFLSLAAGVLAGKASSEEITVNVGDVVSFDIEAAAPTENVDGSPLTDLEELRLYSCTEESCEPIDFRDAYPASAGDAVTMPRTFTPNNQAGEVLVIRYGATAVDSDGNESVLSNVKEYRINFTVPITIPNAPVLGE